MNWRAIAIATLCYSGLSPQSLQAQRVGARSAPDVNLSWRMNLEWSVGGAEDSTLLLSTFKAKDIAVWDGTLLLVDRDRSRIARYASDGRKLNAIGRGDGAGPGELRFPRSIAVDPGGRIIVEDWVNGRLAYFDASGRFVRHQAHASSRSVSQLRAVTDSSLVGLVETSDSISLAVLTSGRLRTLLSIRAPKKVGTPPVCSTTGYAFNALFSPTILYATAGPVLAFTGGDGQVSFVRGDRVLSRHAHSFRRRTTSHAMARAHLGDGIRIQVQGMPPCTVPAAMILKVAELAPELPAYGSLAVDPDGVAWAMRFAVGSEPAFVDVFHPERGYVGTVAAGTVRPVAFLSRSLVVSLETDDEVPVVRVYRITR